MKCLRIFLILMCVLPFATQAQRIVKLYSGNISSEETTSLEDISENSSKGLACSLITPTQEMYLPKENTNEAAVVICPGSGYSVLFYGSEVVLTVKAFAQKGIATFLLKYHLPEDSIQVKKTIAPLQDAQRAIKMMCDTPTNWDIDTDKMDIMGFPAGSRVASAEAMHFDKVLTKNKDNTSLRADYQILVYPGISMEDSLMHQDSRRQLLESNPSKAMMLLYSNELLVNQNAPTAYIRQAVDDTVVTVDNRIVCLEKLRQHNAPAEIHIYRKENHGLVFKHLGWMEPFFEWMQNNIG